MMTQHFVHIRLQETGHTLEAGFDIAGIVEQNTKYRYSLLINCYTCLEMCSSFIIYAIAKRIGVHKCSENQAEKSDLC